MHRLRRRFAKSALGLLALMLVSGDLATTARADGDPASDYLYAASVFIPYDAQPNSTAADQLDRLVENATKSGYQIRIAVIASPEDLGSDTPLWRRPQQYAKFLGTELSLVYQGELLVVMPNGLGVYHAHHDTTSQRQLLSEITPAGGADALESTAQSAVRSLAAAAGHPLGEVSDNSDDRSSGSSKTPAVDIAVLLVELLICLGGLTWLAIRARRRLLERRAWTSGAAGRRRLLLPAVTAAVLLMAGGGVTIAMLDRGTGSTTEPSTATTDLMGLFHYPRGQIAPNFTLTDQRGHRYSLDSFRGHVVVLEFTDSHCQNLCPLISHEFVRAAHELGKTNREVDFVAINANPFHYLRSDVARYSREHGLEALSNWHFMTGPPAQLRAVWKRYGVSVTFNKVKREVEHEAPMLFINRQGRETWLATPTDNPAQINAWGAGIAQMARRLL